MDSTQKALLVMNMPEKCLLCPMLNGSDECILQTIEQNFDADTFDDLLNGCPLRPVPDKLSLDEIQQELIEEDCCNDTSSIDEAYLKGKVNGWNACIDEILKIVRKREEFYG